MLRHFEKPLEHLPYLSRTYLGEHGSRSFERDPKIPCFTTAHACRILGMYVTYQTNRDNGSDSERNQQRDITFLNYDTGETNNSKHNNTNSSFAVLSSAPLSGICLRLPLHSTKAQYYYYCCVCHPAMCSTSFNVDHSQTSTERTKSQEVKTK